MAFALFARVAFLVAVLLLGLTYKGIVQHGFANPDGHHGCHYRSGVLVVHVPRSSVRYARRQGWPRVLRPRMRLGSPLLYDHAPQTDPIRRRADRLCPQQRFRLAAR